MGPLGSRFLVKPAAKNLLLVAGGIGIAPLAFLAEEASRLGKKVTLLQGAAQGASLLYPRHQMPPKATVVGVSEDGSWEKKGLVTGWIDGYVDQADQVFACGPTPMYRAMSGMDCLKRKSVQVSLEERMACGVGACYGCTVKTRMGLRQVCQDGPVFDLADIVW
jgi:dihydroorotate dehydrogenase electron transfer subunit